jgi:hypothetical protein
MFAKFTGGRVVRTKTTKIWGVRAHALVRTRGLGSLGYVTEVSLHYTMSGQQRVDPTPSQIDVAVNAMRRLPRLRQISFHWTGIQDDDLQRFAPLSSQIESLYFNEFHGDLTGNGIRHLIGWPRLKELTFLCRSPSTVSFKHLSSLAALTSFSWHGTLDEEAFDSIANCARLVSLRLFGCSFKGKSLARLQSAKRLKNVLLHNCTAHYVGSTTLDGTPIGEPEYQFHSSGGSPPLRAPDGYREWLGKQLPDMEIQEMFTI